MAGYGAVGVVEWFVEVGGGDAEAAEEVVKRVYGSEKLDICGAVVDIRVGSRGVRPRDGAKGVIRRAQC